MASVNDGISKLDSGMAYSPVSDAAQIILQLGPGTEMAKIDIASAFHLIPVHPEDQYLLGMIKYILTDNCLSVCGLPLFFLMAMLML